MRYKENIVIVSERMLRDIKQEKGCGRGEEKRRDVKSHLAPAAVDSFSFSGSA